MIDQSPGVPGLVKEPFALVNGLLTRKIRDPALVGIPVHEGSVVIDAVVLRAEEMPHENISRAVRNRANPRAPTVLESDPLNAPELVGRRYGASMRRLHADNTIDLVCLKSFFRREFEGKPQSPLCQGCTTLKGGDTAAER